MFVPWDMETSFHMAGVVYSLLGVRTSANSYTLLLFPSEAAAEFHLLWRIATHGLDGIAREKARGAIWRGMVHCERTVVVESRSVRSWRARLEAIVTMCRSRDCCVERKCVSTVGASMSQPRTSAFTTYRRRHLRHVHAKADPAGMEDLVLSHITHAGK